MKGLLKLLTGLVALVVVLLVAGGIILGIFFDPNAYKPEIEQAALEEGGIELKINGDIGWSVFPWLGLEVNQIKVRYPGGEQLASLEQAQLSARLPALLSGQVEMKSIVVSGLKLNLVQYKDGNNNWTGAPGKDKADRDNQHDDKGSAEGAAIALDIDSIAVTDGQVSYIDNVSDMKVLLDQLNLTSGKIVTEQFFPAELSFSLSQSIANEEQLSVDAKVTAEFFLNLAKQQYQIKGLDSAIKLSGKPIGGNTISFTTQADLNADLLTQKAELQNLKLALANLNATGNLAVSDFQAPVINGQLAVKPFALNKLLTAIGQAEVQTSDPKALQAISFNTALAGPANTVTAKTIDLQLDDTHFTGNAAFNLKSGAITLNLQGDKLNADRYTPPASGQEEKAGKTEGSKGYSKEPVIPVDALKGLALDARIGLSALHVAKLDITNLEYQISAHNGLIRMDKINADLYSGTMRNKVLLDLNKKPVLMRSQKNISGIQIGDMLKAAADVDRLTGTFNSKSDITTRGVSVYDFVNSATGTASVNMKDGELKGIDMAQTVCQGMNNISSLGIDTQEVDRSTPFANMGATTVIKNGVVTNNDLKAQLDAMTLQGKGKVNLPKQMLDYRLGFMVEKNLFKETCSFPDKLEGVEIPVDCKGSFDTEPAKLCKPDLSFLTEVAKKEAKKKVEKKLKDKLDDKLGDKLKGLFGR